MGKVLRIKAIYENSNGEYTNIFLEFFREKGSKQNDWFSETPLEIQIFI